MKILLIEDEVQLADATAKLLKSNNFIVSIAYNGESALELLAVEEFSIVLLDLNLPDMDGLDVLNEIRRESSLPVIILSARQQTNHVIDGLNLGADDYIVKPFKFEILLARIFAIERRSNGIYKQEIDIFGLVLNRSKQYIKYDTNSLTLTRKEYLILEKLMINYPEYVSSEEIIDDVYEPGFNPFSSVIRVHFSNLRKRLSYYTKDSFSIESMKGQGYKICYNSKLK